MPARGKRLVIDSDITSSASESDVEPAKSCRELLEAVLHSTHRVVMTEAGSREWREHRSGFSKRWRSAMESRRRLDYVAGDLRPDLETGITRLFVDEREHAAVIKDLHLVAGALATDRIIFSRDDVARTSMRHAARTIRELARIHWTNPTNPAEGAVDWVKAGAPAERARQLGFKAVP